MHSYSTNRISLVQQVLGGMLIVCLLPILIVNYQSYHCSRQAVMELQESALNAQLHAKEKQLQNWLDERRKDLDSLAGASCVLICNSASKNQGCRLFNIVSSRKETYEALYLYDPNWRLLEKQAQYEHSGTDFLTSTQKTDIEKSDALFFSSAHSHTDGTFSIHVGCRLMNNGKISGFAFAVMNATHAVASVLADKESPYHLKIIDSDGMDILNPRQANPEQSLPQVILKGTHRLQAYQNSSGEDVVGVSKRMPSLNWTLTLEAQEDDTLRWVDTLQKRSLLTALLSFLATLVLAGFLARSITAPFKQLAATARKVSSGSIHSRADSGTARESGEVALAFNEMLDSLEKLRIDLSQQTALAAIGQLSSSVVHEMRNPLSSIRLNLQALSRKVEGDPIHSELAEIAREQTDRLEYLLNELLQFGKPVVLHKAAVAYPELAKWIKQDAAPMLVGKNITLEIAPMKEAAHLHIDPAKVRQVFINLIENAVYACGEKGVIRIDSTREGELFKVVVQDSGSGIPETILPELFQPFITGRSDGTGLGLANVKKITELHGGSVSAHNLQAGGAEFVVSLPCFEADEHIY